MKRVILLVICLMLLSAASYSAVIRVKTDGVDTNTGSSWGLAKKTVTAALNAAGSSDEIWVAKGTYVERITLKNGVKLYGGFAGTETLLSQRNWTTNVTVLDGNAARSVVTSPSGVTTTAKISGFTIRNGKSSDGGGIYCDHSSPTISNNIIKGNSTDYQGGGINCYYASPIISSNIIIGNDAVYGGGISCYFSTSTIINNTLLGNSASGIYCSSSSPSISNNIIAYNSPGIYCSINSTPNLRNNCIYNPGGINYYNLSAGTGDISVDPMLVSIEYGQVHIQPASPCRNAGYYSTVISGTLDMDGEARIQSTIVDIGADESNGTTWTYIPKVIRVSPTGNDVNDGSSWTLAKKTVQAAINDASLSSGDIWVAKGIYTEKINLKSFTYLYGGFAGNETLLDQRNIRNNETTLDGSGAGGSVVTANKIGHHTSKIDGFTIRNGNTARGAGVYCNNASPIIMNNRITGNKAEYDGGGIYCFDSSAFISNNIIIGNGAFSSGGIHSVEEYTPSSLFIINNTIVANSGAGVFCYYASSSVYNNIIAYNSSGICTTGGTSILRNNCIYNPDGYNYSGISAGTGDISADPKLVSIEYGQVHIQPDSPCKDAGYDAAVGIGTLDIDAEARIQGSHVDIGADESNGTTWTYTPRVIRVSNAGVDANDGSSWALAKKTVQAAIDDASVFGADIWVAKGIYTERIKLKPFAHLYGGFTGNETTLVQRDWRANATILDGSAGGSVITAYKIGHWTSKIDGFTIRNGKAANGAGIYCYFSSLIISNNTITANSTIYGSGGGIYCYFSSSTISNNTITGNNATKGGGLYCEYYSSLLSNNTIVANSATNGGGLYCSHSSPKISNNTLLGNSVSDIHCSYSFPAISNNIIAYSSQGIHCDGTSTPTLRNNCIFNPGGTDYSGISAGVGDISVDPKLVSIEYGQVHIQPDSPCKDAGYDAAVGIGSLDIDAEARIQGSHVDIGADESNGTTWTYTPRVIRVSNAGVDANDGSSWALAKKTVQAAIDDASVFGADIWVAKGIYTERIKLKPFAHLYGGFTGNETTLVQRDWRANATILDGSASGSVVTVDSIGYNTSGIDGFTIRNGKASSGGGIYCSQSSFTISNNIIIGNTANSGHGGGIFCYISSMTIQSNIIKGNAASSSGGGICCNSCSMTISSNTITGNNASSSGGGISYYSCTMSISGNTITGNSASSNGGGLYCSSTLPSLHSLSNNIVAYNSSGIYKVDSSYPALRNNCVYNPSGADYTGLTAGTGDISIDPLFVDRTNGNYHLSIGSPCINAGYDTAVGAGSLDMDGQTRVMGSSVDIGSDELSGSALAVGTAKGISDGLAVSGYGAIVTAVFGDSFYIESNKRSSGIRVEKAGHLLSPDMAVDIDGVLATSADGERYIAAKSATQCGVGNVKSMYMTGKNLGGALSTGQRGVEAGIGLNNIGLLVKLTGYVKQISSGYFIIEDGSKVTDASGIAGVRVIYANLDQSKMDKLVSVEGISSIIKDNNNYYRCLRALDIVPIDTAQ